MFGNYLAQPIYNENFYDNINFDDNVSNIRPTDTLSVWSGQSQYLNRMEILTFLPPENFFNQSLETLHQAIGPTPVFNPEPRVSASLNNTHYLTISKTPHRITANMTTIFYNKRTYSNCLKYLLTTDTGDKNLTIIRFILSNDYVFNPSTQLNEFFVSKGEGISLEYLFTKIDFYKLHYYLYKYSNDINLAHLLQYKHIMICIIAETNEMFLCIVRPIINTNTGAPEGLIEQYINICNCTNIMEPRNITGDSSHSYFTL